MTATSLPADMAMFLGQPELALMRAFANLDRVSIIALRVRFNIHKCIQPSALFPIAT